LRVFKKFLVTFPIDSPKSQDTLSIHIYSDHHHQQVCPVRQDLIISFPHLEIDWRMKIIIVRINSNFYYNAYCYYNAMKFLHENNKKACSCVNRKKNKRNMHIWHVECRSIFFKYILTLSLISAMKFNRKEFIKFILHTMQQ